METLIRHLPRGATLARDVPAVCIPSQSSALTHKPATGCSGGSCARTPWSKLVPTERCNTPLAARRKHAAERRINPTGGVKCMKQAPRHAPNHAGGQLAANPAPWSMLGTRPAPASRAGSSGSSPAPLQPLESKATGSHLPSTARTSTALGLLRLHRHGLRKGPSGPQSLPTPSRGCRQSRLGASTQGWVPGRRRAAGGSDGHTLPAQTALLLSKTRLSTWRSSCCCRGLGTRLASVPTSGVSAATVFLTRAPNFKPKGQLSQWARTEDCAEPLRSSPLVNKSRMQTPWPGTSFKTTRHLTVQPQPQPKPSARLQSCSREGNQSRAHKADGDFSSDVTSTQDGPRYRRSCLHGYLPGHEENTDRENTRRLGCFVRSVRSTSPVEPQEVPDFTVSGSLKMTAPRSLPRSRQCLTENPEQLLSQYTCTAAQPQWVLHRLKPRAPW